MAKTSTCTVGVTVVGDSVNESYTPAALSNVAAPAGGPISIALASGDNTITIPPGAIAVLIVPPATSVIVKKLKGIAGDTGFQISTTALSLLSLPAASSTVLLNASNTETISVHWL